MEGEKDETKEDSGLESFIKHYVHSRLGYISPEEFEEKYESQHMKSAA